VTLEGLERRAARIGAEAAARARRRIAAELGAIETGQGLELRGPDAAERLRRIGGLFR
jgi:hypothetical protein